MTEGDALGFAFAQIAGKGNIAPAVDEDAAYGACAAAVATGCACFMVDGKRALLRVSRESICRARVDACGMFALLAD